MKTASLLTRASLQKKIVMLLPVLGLIWFNLVWAAPQARETFPKTRTTATAAAAGEMNPAAPPSELTLWQMLEMLDWTFWPFVFVVASGMMLISWRALSDYQDRSRSKNLLSKPIVPSSLNQFGNIVSMMPPSRASKLFTHLILTFNKTNRADSLHEETNNYLSEDRGAYETFNRVIAFLSETSGALGLLGTVWGIFVTFYGGKLDGATILNGMGVALITTLVGLIVSLAFNLGSTALFALYNAHMKNVSARAEELRQALLAVQRNPAIMRKNGAASRRTPTSSDDYADDIFAGREKAGGHAF